MFRPRPAAPGSGDVGLAAACDYFRPDELLRLISGDDIERNGCFDFSRRLRLRTICPSSNRRDGQRRPSRSGRRRIGRPGGHVFIQPVFSNGNGYRPANFNHGVCGLCAVSIVRYFQALADTEAGKVSGRLGDCRRRFTGRRVCVVYFADLHQVFYFYLVRHSERSEESPLNSNALLLTGSLDPSLCSG
jgi:hypothetical protein